MTIYKDMKPITHPAFYVGEKDLYMFFKDEYESVYFLTRSPGEPSSLFDIGDVVDADEAVPVEFDKTAKCLLAEII